MTNEIFESTLRPVERQRFILLFSFGRRHQQKEEEHKKKGQKASNEKEKVQLFSFLARLHSFTLSLVLFSMNGSRKKKVTTPRKFTSADVEALIVKLRSDHDTAQTILGILEDAMNREEKKELARQRKETKRIKTNSSAKKASTFDALYAQMNPTTYHLTRPSFVLDTKEQSSDNIKKEIE